MPEPKQVKPATPAARPAIPREGRTLSIVGPKLPDYTALVSTHLGLLCGPGIVDEQSVLVPYVQVRLHSVDESIDEPEESEAEAFAATVAYENAAFILMDFARDFRDVSRRLKTFSSGELKPDDGRIVYAKGCLERAKVALQDSIDILADLETTVLLPPESKPRQTRLRRPSKPPT